MLERMVDRAARAAAVTLAGVLIWGCTSAAPSATTPPSPIPATSAPTATPEPSEGPWAADLAYLDTQVRGTHPGPFTIHPESEWLAKIDELEGTLPNTTDAHQQLVQLASLVGLLDTHSWLNTPSPSQFYDLLLYPFSDGWFVIAAVDPSLVGARVVSIAGIPVEDVVDRFAPLVPHDNHSGLLDSVQGLLSSIEYLHGAGIVSDISKPQYLVTGPDGASRTVDPGQLDGTAWETQLGIVGDLIGPAPEAVNRRTEADWWRTDKKNNVFLLSYNDYVDPAAAIAAMTDALDSGAVDRVVLDLRYLRGGNGSVAFPLVDALAGEARINRDGGLTVLIGRENVSAGTVIVRMLEADTRALLVGEPTPARPDGFLCECIDVSLPNSRFVVTLPTFSFHTGDQRSEIAPAMPMALAAADFFAGRDPVLDGALHGLVPPPAP